MIGLIIIATIFALGIILNYFGDNPRELIECLQNEGYIKNRKTK